MTRREERAEFWALQRRYSALVRAFQRADSLDRRIGVLKQARRIISQADQIVCRQMAEARDIAKVLRDW